MSRIRSAAFAFACLLPMLAIPATAKDNSLYQRLGGYDAIVAVTDDFLGRLTTDEKFARFFVGFSTDSKQRIRQHVVDLMCQTTGGPCLYTGRTMKTSHAGIGITKTEWDAAIVAMGATLEKLKVPEQEQKELAALLAPLEADIVEAK